jgi:hypothetical protein
MQRTRAYIFACTFVILASAACTRSRHLDGHWKGVITSEGNQSDQLPVEVELAKSLNLETGKLDSPLLIGQVRIGQGAGTMNLGQPFTLSNLLVVSKENNGLFIAASPGTLEPNNSISFNGTVSANQFSGRAVVSRLNDIRTDGKVVLSGSFRLNRE